MEVILFHAFPLIVLKFKDRVDWCTLIAYSIYSNFENNVVIILPNRSVSSTQTTRTVVMKCHLAMQRRCRKTASQAYVDRIFSLCSLLAAGCRNRVSQNLEMRAFIYET